MSYINQAKQNKLNAEKARAFDEQQAVAREREIYDFGRTDGTAEAYGAVQQELRRRAEERAVQYQIDGLASRFRG